MTAVNNNNKPQPTSSSSTNSTSSASKTSSTTASKPPTTQTASFKPTSTTGNAQPDIGGIPKGAPIRPTGELKPTGSTPADDKKAEGETKPADSPKTEENKDDKKAGGDEKSPKTSQEWADYLNPNKSSKDSSVKSTDAGSKEDKASDKKTTSDGPPKSGQDWLNYLKGATQPKTGAEWLSYLKKGADGIGEAVKAARGKIIGNVATPKWANNVLAAFASNSQNTVGWFGSQGTAMSDWVSKNGGKDIMRSLANHVGKSYPGFPQNAKTQGWQSKGADGNTFLNSRFNPTKANVDKGLEVFYAGFAKGGGGDNWAFAKGTNKFNKALENALGDKNVTSFRRNQATTRDMEDVFKKVRDYALKNPNKPISLVAHWNTHGGRSGGGAEGAAAGFDLFGNEGLKKQLISKYFGGLKNVAVIPIIECCHAGAQIS